MSQLLRDKLVTFFSIFVGVVCILWIWIWTSSNDPAE